MKKLLFNEQEKYTEKGIEVDKEIYKSLNTLLLPYIEQGYSIVELKSILFDNAQYLFDSYFLDRECSKNNKSNNLEDIESIREI